METIRNIFRRNGRGFTLIELLVVIAIIGILASIVLASLNTARRKSRDARRIADIKQIQLALELYADASGQLYPLASATCDAATARGLQVLAPGNIPVLPRDPSREVSAGVKGCYAYATNSGAGVGEAPARSNYHLAAFLEESTNPAVLNGDRDCDSDSTNNCITPSAAYTAPFKGKSPDCSAAFVATDQCYDITN